MAEYIVIIDKDSNNISLEKTENSIQLSKEVKNITFEHYGRKGDNGEKGADGGV